jgi:hypothetical protein
MNRLCTCAVAGVAAACLVVLPGLARAGDIFVHVPLEQMDFAGAKLPDPDRLPDSYSFWRNAFTPYAVLDGPGEAYITVPPEPGRQWDRPAFSKEAAVFVAKLASDKPVTGTVFVPDAKWEKLVPLKFTLKPAASETRKDFYHAKAEYYETLQSSRAPGGAFFRHEADIARREAGDDPSERTPDWNTGRVSVEFDDTYDLFSGGRAVSENLQLTRTLPAAPGQKEDPDDLVDTAKIEGITIASFDWASRLGDAKPALDALATAIPADQHAIFFPSFAALMTSLDTVRTKGLPIYHSVGLSTEDGMLLERYEHQLCLPQTALTRLVGPGVIKSVAITGGDPYFPTGTDVAVLFETPKPEALRTLLLAQFTAACATPGVAAKTGKVDAISYEGAVSDNRSICSYVATIGSTTVVTNSLEQIKRLAAVAGGVPSIASLGEYAFFRNRYPVSDANETAFVFMSDPAIRRWCGPQSRIGASRRLRAAAVMSDATASHMDELVAGLAAPAAFHADVPMRTIGDLILTATGVQSSVYGNLGFITPISELDLKSVTAEEAAAYKRWRSTYQRNWNWAFDPIAISVSLGKDKLSADASIMPLIMSSQYNIWAETTKGVAIAPDSGDPHDSIAHYVIALNTQSVGLQQAGGFAMMMAQGVQIDPLGWMGQSVALYVDPDPVWERLHNQEDLGKQFEKDGVNLPIALHAEVSSAIKLTAFLASVRAYIEQSSPGMAAWEARTYHDQPYVCVGLSEKARAESRGEGFDKTKIFYVATPKALVITPNEDLLKRSIDRMAARAKAPQKEVPAHPWLGKSLSMRFEKQALSLVNLAFSEKPEDAARHRALSNLPILTEWKRRYPDKDPLVIHQTFWGVRLTDPGAGSFVWDDQFKTMASTTYGHQGDPKPGPELLEPVKGIKSGDFGVTLEDQALRSKVVIEFEGK